MKLPESGIIINYVDYQKPETKLDDIYKGLQKFYDSCLFGEDMAGEVRFFHIDGINKHSLNIANAYVYKNGVLDDKALNQATERIKMVAEHRGIKIYVTKGKE